MKYDVQQIYDDYMVSGHDSATRQGWTSAVAQLANFTAVYDAFQTLQVPLQGLSVHDVGCGLGDLYAFLQERGGTKHYLGTDINGHAIATALRRYPGVDFRMGEIAPRSPSPTRAEVTIAIGTLAFHKPRLVEEMLHVLWADTEVALAFICWWNLDKGYVYHEHAAALQKVVRRFLRDIRPSQTFERIGDFAEPTDALFIALR